MIPLLDENGKPRLDDGRFAIESHGASPQRSRRKNVPHQSGTMWTSQASPYCWSHRQTRSGAPERSCMGKFMVRFDCSEVENIMTYNQILSEIITMIMAPTGRHIIGHQHTPQGHKDRKESEYNEEVNGKPAMLQVNHFLSLLVMLKLT